MARTPMVTRTITLTRANVLCLNVTNAEPFNVLLEVPHRCVNTDKLLELAKKEINTDDVKVVHIVDLDYVEHLYGMSEEDFIKNAEILPARKTKKEDETHTTI